jgi:hypothetical protein
MVRPGLGTGDTVLNMADKGLTSRTSQAREGWHLERKRNVLVCHSLKYSKSVTCSSKAVDS